MTIAACEPAPTPLRENPEFAAREWHRQAAIELREHVRAMSPADVIALEARWKANPEDLETLRQILIHYAPDFSGRPSGISPR